MSAELSAGHKANYDTVLEAAKADRLVLFASTHKATGEHVALLCGVNYCDDGDFELIPLARMLNDDNPFEAYESVDESLEALARALT